MVILYSKFESLPEDKRKKIIDVCVEEFSQNGYKNASTNNIVKNAEISKGILFHYFGSKKSLYLYVFDYATQFLSEKIYGAFEVLPGDFFERIMKIGMAKLQLAHEYPALYKFVLEAVTHAPGEIEEELNDRYQKVISENMPVIFKDIDTSRFKEGIDRDKAVEIIMFAFEGLTNKYYKLFKSISPDGIINQMESLNEGFYEYIDILKRGIYENNE